MRINKNLLTDMKGKRLGIIAISLFAFMIIMQVVILNSFTIEQHDGDSATYQSLAKTAATKGTFYPSEDNIYAKHIANPGYINYLSIYYRISQSDYVPLYGNVVLTAVLALLIFYIAVKLFDDIRVGFISVILFTIFPVNYFEVMFTRSDTLYTVLVFAAVAIVISELRSKYIPAGVFIALANFTRPLALSVFAAIILHLILMPVLTKDKIKNIVIFSLSTVAIVLLLGLASYISSGYFVYQSTTGGINLLFGANDDARGDWRSGSIVDNVGRIGYIEDPFDLTFKEKNEFYTSQALNWIKENPMKYIALFPAKLFYLYAKDTYSFEYIKTQEISITDSIRRGLISDLGWQEYVILYNQFIYMLVFFLSITSLIVYIKKKMYTQTAMLIAIVIFGTGMTILTVGMGRYHYPFLPIFIMFAGWLMNWILFDKRGKLTLREDRTICKLTQKKHG